MVRKEPIFRKCCFCIRLQAILQTWACFKIIVDIALILFLMFVAAGRSYNFRYMDSHVVLVLVVVVALAVDVIFVVLLSVGLCTKNIRCLQVFFYYSIYMAIAGATFAIGMVFYISPTMDVYDLSTKLLIAAVVGGFINSALDVGIILTLRSEIIKLQNKALHVFHKMPTFKGASTEQDEEERLNA